MPDTVYTRPDGSTTTTPSLLDRIFNGPATLSPFTRYALSAIPYFGPAYALGRTVNGVAHSLGGAGATGTTSEVQKEASDPSNAQTVAYINARARALGLGAAPPQRAAFAPSIQQLHFPGSAIGPGAFGTSGTSAAVRARNAAGLGSLPGGHETGIPGWAAAAYANIISKNRK